MLIMSKSNFHWVKSILVSAATIVIVVTTSELLLPQSGSQRVSVKLTYGSTIKVENNRIIAAAGNSQDVRTSQVDIFNVHGEKILELNPLKSVEGAWRVGIWDVSVGPTGMLAVAAVFVDALNRTAAALLIYSNTGGLKDVIRLTTEYEIRALELDEEENIWAMGSGAGDADPDTTPMLVIYDSAGNVLKKFLPYSEFPEDARIVRQGPQFGGVPSFGITADKMWLWLPATRQLVTMNREGGDIRILHTGLPLWPGPQPASGEVTIDVTSSCWLPPGRFLAQVGFYDGSERRKGLFDWNSRTGAWNVIRLYDPKLPQPWFVGVDKEQLVWMTYARETSVTEFSWEALPPS